MVEDDWRVAPILKEAVERDGVEVVLVTNQEAEEAAIREGGWNLLTLDRDMPRNEEDRELKPHGYDLLRNWYKEGLLPPLVLVNTAFDQEGFQEVIDELKQTSGRKEEEPGGGRVEMRAVSKRDLFKEILN